MLHQWSFIKIQNNFTSITISRDIQESLTRRYSRLRFKSKGTWRRRWLSTGRFVRMFRVKLLLNLNFSYWRDRRFLLSVWVKVLTRRWVYGVIWVYITKFLSLGGNPIDDILCLFFIVWLLIQALQGLWFQISRWRRCGSWLNTLLQYACCLWIPRLIKLFDRFFLMIKYTFWLFCLNQFS